MLRSMCFVSLVLLLVATQVIWAQSASSARVRVTQGNGSFQPWRPGVPIDALNPRHIWSELPSTWGAEGVDIWQLANGSGDVDGGRISFEAVTDGHIYLAISDRFGGGGGSNGNWIPELTTLEELFDDGWQQIDDRAAFTSNGASAEFDFQILLRDSTAGESFTYRTEKYYPPLPILSQRSVVLNSENGHYYQWIESPVTWEEARDDAKSRSFNGMPGYLATVTSESENNFLLDLIEGRSFLGGSDAGQEGVWKWVTGPEAGQVMHVGNYPDPTRTSVLFTDWGRNEPNDFDNTVFDFPYAGEDYLALGTRDGGEWNDLPGAPLQAAYIVEYGGLPREGDFNGDGKLTPHDIDLMSMAIRDSTNISVFDLNLDGQVDQRDHSTLILQTIGTVFGDANLDRQVGFDDFLLLAAEFGNAGGWASGDFNGSLHVTFDDFLLLANAFDASARIASVPEPHWSPVVLTIGGLFTILRTTKLRSRSESANPLGWRLPI